MRIRPDLTLEMFIMTFLEEKGLQFRWRLRLNSRNSSGSCIFRLSINNYYPLSAILSWTIYVLAMAIAAAAPSGCQPQLPEYALMDIAAWFPPKPYLRNNQDSRHFNLFARPHCPVMICSVSIYIHLPRRSPSE